MMTQQSSAELMKARRKGVLISAAALAGMVFGIYVMSLFLLRAGGMQ